jgi:hypothetical protein
LKSRSYYSYLISGKLSQPYLKLGLFFCFELGKSLDIDFYLNRIKIISFYKFDNDIRFCIILIFITILVYLLKFISFTNMNSRKTSQIIIFSFCFHFFLNIGYFMFSSSLLFYSFFFLFLKIIFFVDLITSLMLFKLLFNQINILNYFIIKDISIFLNSIIGFIGIHFFKNHNSDVDMTLINVIFNIFSIIAFYHLKKIYEQNPNIN